MRGCGVPESLIHYLPSLMGKSIDCYSCFISYTEKDDAFAERLYNDLQGKGVRCWRWREDAKWGHDLWGQIDGAVRLYDKLIVICSEHSLQSPAVLEEIGKALDKEDLAFRDGKPSEVLFPITIDDYIFDGWDHPRKGRLTKKFIGDFRKWKAPDSHGPALDKLIRDLRQEG